MYPSISIISKKYVSKFSLTYIDFSAVTFVSLNRILSLTNRNKTLKIFIEFQYETC